MRRVVITGIGAISPLGTSAPKTWERATNGESGIKLIKQFDTEDCPVKFGGEVQDYDVGAATGPFRPKEGKEITQIASVKDSRKMGRFIQFCLGATFEAYGDSGLDAHRSKISPDRIGVNIGVGMGGLDEIAVQHNILREKGYRRISPFFIPQVIPNLAAGHVSMLLDTQGPNLCNLTACSSSAHAVGESFRMIQRGDVDIFIAGGAEAVMCQLGIGGFAAMRALSTRNDAPEKASRPFDKDRDGFVMGEGAATLILEEYEMAKKRGAKIYAEIKGYGLSSDAFHMTLPAPNAEGGFRAMSMALKDSGLNSDQIGYANAHGTSTPAGDTEEARALKRLCPGGDKHLHVSSTKSMTGHLLGAAGAIESMFTALALQKGVIPPTINLDNLDPDCAELGLDFTANQAAEKKLDYALTNSFGFGGTNASLILGRI